MSLGSAGGAVPGDATLAFGGNSIAAGATLSAPTTERYAALVAAQLGLRTVALDAVPGYRLDQLEARWSTYMAPGVASRSPGSVLVMEGAYNDFAQGADDATIRARFTAYVAAARASGVRKIVYLLCFAAPGSSSLAGIDYEARRVAHNAWVVASGLVDAVVNFDAVSIDVAAPPDGLHPTAAGHATMAPLISAAVHGVL